MKGRRRETVCVWGGGGWGWSKRGDETVLHT